MTMMEKAFLFLEFYAAAQRGVEKTFLDPKSSEVDWREAKRKKKATLATNDVVFPSRFVFFYLRLPTSLE